MSTLPERNRARTGRWVTTVALGLACAGGCTWDQWNVFKSPPPPPPGESLILRGDKMEAEPKPAEGPAAARLAEARELYRAGEYSKAERLFHRVAEGEFSGISTFFGMLSDKKKISPPIAEEARFYEAECLRHQGRYPKAADTYNRMLNDFPSGAYREQAVQHMFDIADYWLDDTRKEMRDDKEQREGKRWVVWPEIFHIQTSKPFLDEEGRAMEKLEQVRYNDMTGPLADKSLFLMGSIKFFRKDYKEADHYYSQLVEMHPNSPYVTEAIKLAIISKELSPGGPAYDGRRVAEARKLVDTALRSYPELATKESEFLSRQLFSITVQQAEKDYNVAEFYQRVGKPCSAYFCYEIVRRRYPGTKYAELANDRMTQLRSEVEKKGGDLLPNVPPPPANVPQPNVAPQSVRAPAQGKPAVPGLVPGMPLGGQSDTSPPRQLPSGMLTDPGRMQ